MAKGDKVKPLKNIYDRDKEFFSTLSKVGHLTADNCYTNFKNEIAPKRIQTYVSNKIIQKVIRDGKESYKFTSKGKEYIKKNITDLKGNRIDKFYNSQNPHHDLKITDTYYNKLTEQQRDNFLNEKEVKEYIFDKWNSMENGQAYHNDYNSGKMSLPDGGYIEYVNGVETIICIEVYTNTYGDVDIQTKVDMCNTINAELRCFKA